jgi:hypothetical protein
MKRFKSRNDSSCNLVQNKSKFSNNEDKSFLDVSQNDKCSNRPKSSCKSPVEKENDQSFKPWYLPAKNTLELMRIKTAPKDAKSKHNRRKHSFKPNKFWMIRKQERGSMTRREDDPDHEEKRRKVIERFKRKSKSQIRLKCKATIKTDRFGEDKVNNGNKLVNFKSKLFSIILALAENKTPYQNSHFKNLKVLKSKRHS